MVNKLKWIALASSVISAVLLGYLQYVFVFDSTTFPQSLTNIAHLSWLTGCVAGFASIRTWQGVSAVFISLIIGYFLLFTPVWAIS